HVLVPYRNIEVKLKFLEEGIVYDELSEEDKERYEEDFTDEDGEMPEYIPSPELNEFIFNQSTVDTVLEDLMTKGLKVAGGDRLGKTIIFAQNKRHAQYIVERFNALYPQYKGGFAQRVVCDDNYAQTIITDFKVPDKEPHIAVSVDMLDTGVDVPEIVNLVFFKRVRSKIKFWQMIGRGTRLCKDLFGPGKDKQYFLIFDYLGNFEFFRTHKEGIEGSEVQSLTEAIFAKRVRLIHHLQHADYMDEAHQALRDSLVETVLAQINALNPELISVKLQLQHVEKYKHKEAFVCLSENDKENLIKCLAPLVYMDDADEHAKRFDNFMYGLMLALLEGKAQYNRGKRELINISNSLQRKATIPQVNSKIELIKTIGSNEFWENANILNFEKVRVEIRELIKFIMEGEDRKIIYTNLQDEVISVQEGKNIDPGFTFEDYKLKVNRYIEENKDHIAIYKLRHNTPLTQADYKELERIFTGELGTAEDYQREFKDTPFGLLVRKIAKLDYQAACEAFSEFINDQSLNQEQIVFVKKVIDYIVKNGYIENISELMKPPFDKPQSFIRLFDSTKQRKMVETINKIKENATKIVG
ncbi:MAG TPA: type I restriction-modification enzyme R subunit C-terminal domain-containing protein, partial [Thermoclostridium caenicola]|uniref:type I restriction-modification enzyme R subunit C-terminal domain-containing protein n=1 Tax=Thermoclostridium caenicola TaxID=659425 RepID=UPI002C76E017